MEPLPNFADMLGTPRWAIQLQETLEDLMVSVADALAGWRGYVDALNAHISDLQTQLLAANELVQQLKDTDAVEDAAQAQLLTDQIAQQIQDALTAAQNPPAAPPDAVNNPDETPPSDTPPVDTPPADTGDTGEVVGPPVDTPTDTTSEEVPPTE